MKRDECEVDETGGETRGCDHVKPICARKMFALDFLAYFEIARIGKKITGAENDRDRYDRGDKQKGKCIPVISVPNNVNEITSGPIVAPAWSSASFKPKTQPRPI